MSKLRLAAVVALVVAMLFAASPTAQAASPGVTVSSVNGHKSSREMSLKRGKLSVRGTTRGLPALVADAGDSAFVRVGDPVHVAATTANATNPITYEWSYDGASTRFATPHSVSTTFDTKGLPQGPVRLRLSVRDGRGVRATSSVLMFLYQLVTTTSTTEGTIGPGENYQLGYTDTRTVPYSVKAGTVATDLTLDWEDPNPAAALPDPVGPPLSDLDLYVQDPSHRHDNDTEGAGLGKPERLHIDAPQVGAWSALVKDSNTIDEVAYHLTIANQAPPASPLPTIEAGGPYRFETGQTQRLRATVTGGRAPYTVRWDPTGAGTFSEAGTSLTTNFGLGAHLVAVKVTDANGYSARSMTPVRIVRPGDTGHTSPYVVVAVNDTGINPYHLDWAASTYPDAGVLAASESFARDPASYIDGYPAGTPALPVHLGQGYLPAADTKLWTDDGDASKIKLETLYWIPGTKIIGARDSGGGDGSGQPETTARILDTNGHGTASASVAVGNIYGSCTFCLLVVDKGLGDVWPYSQPWIDIVSNSFSTQSNVGAPGVLPPDVPADVAERGQLALYAAGNGNEDAFLTPEQTYTSNQSGPDWVIRIGAVDRETRQPFLGTGKPVTASSFGLGDIPAADHQSVGGETQHNGTSAATPISAGVFGTALGASRSALDDGGVGQRSAGQGVIARGAAVASSGYLKDGVLTRSELVEAVLRTARHGEEPPSISIPESVPPNQFQYAVEGHGILDQTSARRAVDALVRNGPLEPLSSDAADFFARDSALRVQLWGSWAGGGANSAHPSTASSRRQALERYAPRLGGVRRSSVSTFLKAMDVLGSLQPRPAATAAEPPATISITSPHAGEVVARGAPTLRVSGAAKFPPSSLPGNPTRYFLRRDACGSTDTAKPDNPHLSRDEDKEGTDEGDGCGQVFQALAPTGVAEFSEEFPLPAGELPAVLGSGRPVSGRIVLSILGVDPGHTITVQLIDRQEVIGTQDVTESALGVPGVAPGLTEFPFSFPVPADQVGKAHAQLALKVITRMSTAVQAGTKTTGSYVEIPRAVGVTTKGASVDVAVDSAKFSRAVRASIAPDGTWAANVPTKSLKSGAHQLFARLVQDGTVAATSSSFSLAAPTGPGLVQIVLTRPSGRSYVYSAGDSTSSGTFSKWQASIDTSKLRAGEYRMTTRVLRDGVETARAPSITLTLS